MSAVVADNCAAEPQHVANRYLADNSVTSALVRYWSNSEHSSTLALIASVANNYCNADAGETRTSELRRRPTGVPGNTVSTPQEARLSGTAAVGTSRHFVAL